MSAMAYEQLVSVQSSATSGQVPKANGSGGYTWETPKAYYEKPSGGIPSTDLAESYYLASNPNGYTSNTGTVKSVRVQATSPVQSSTSTAQSASLNTTISLASGYGDTQNPYGSKDANKVLAAPNGSNGDPTFRALVAADIPSIPKSKISDFPTSMAPTSHASTHATGGSDAITPSEIGAIPVSEKGTASGVATLTSATKVIARQITAPVATTISADTTLTDGHIGNSIRVSAAVTITLPTLTDGDEVEIWNTGSGDVTLSGTMFLAGTGNVTSCKIEAYQVAGCKLMDGRWYVSGGVSE